jgi:hypothetical protein
MEVELKKVSIITACLVGLILLAACQGGNRNGAAVVVERYFQALVEKEANRLASLSCRDWEKNARQELDAFGSVKTTLRDLSCKESGRDGNFTLVSCQGKIIATYGNENQEFSLENQTFLVNQENGEWRMCGLKGTK